MSNHTGLMANHERYFGTVATMQETNLLRILEDGEPVELPPTLFIAGWTATEVVNMITRLKRFIAQRLATGVGAD